MAKNSESITISTFIPLPICVINREGKVLNVNDEISKVFPYTGIVDGDIFALTGVRASELYESAETEMFSVIERNNRHFRLLAHTTGDYEGSNLVIIFNDITGFTDLKDRYNEEKPCIAKIQIDNYDELFPAGGGMRPELAGEIDKLVRTWAQKINGSISRINGSNYNIWFEQEHLEAITESRFDILNDVRDLETGVDFPASLSIGIGAGGRTLKETESYADTALDLAQGRGGDQAVIKRNLKVEYYGGKLQTVEKSNKGKSRIIAHALMSLVIQSRRIFIMGHKNADMDSFGASLGIARFCKNLDREPFIVMNETDETLGMIYKQARDSGEYKFINAERAAGIADTESLVIVVDTHKAQLVQCPKLLEISDKTVIIDHHRKMEGFIENPVLCYMESYASSASELVTEMLRFSSEKKLPERIEAEALLAGITLDTNGFTMKTGVRTFEAAAWLRRRGADPMEVKRLFQQDFEEMRQRAEAIAEAVITDGFAVARLKEVTADAQVLCAQVAGELLSAEGVKASFAVGRNFEKTVMSARSLGDVNVQVIMEKFGGGGHFNVAAAQVDETPEEVTEKLICFGKEKLW